MLAIVPAQICAQGSTDPAFADPRIQTLSWPLLGPTQLIAFPGTDLTVLLLPGERAVRMEISDPSAYAVSVSEDADALTIRPLVANAAANITLQTTRDTYSFSLETGRGLSAANVVRLVERNDAVALNGVKYEPGPIIGKYRLSGDNLLRPIRIGDDGRKTFIEWGEYQSLPAVFGVGPTGSEEVVPGYMRDGRFTIDRIYSQLVFRIDSERARATRHSTPGEP